MDSHPEAAAKIITILRGYTNLLELMADQARYIMDDVAETLQQRGITKQHPKFIDLTTSKLMGALYRQYDFNFVLHNIPEFEAKMHEMVKGIQRYWAGE